MPYKHVSGTDHCQLHMVERSDNSLHYAKRLRLLFVYVLISLAWSVVFRCHKCLFQLRCCMPQSQDFTTKILTLYWCNFLAFTLTELKNGPFLTLRIIFLSFVEIKKTHLIAIYRLRSSLSQSKLVVK